MLKPCHSELLQLVLLLSCKGTLSQLAITLVGEYQFELPVRAILVTTEANTHVAGEGCA